MITENDRADLPLDSALDLLSNAHRRRLVTALQRQIKASPDGRVPAEVITGAEEWRALEVELRHVHLPKLAAAEVIRWEENGAIIGAGPRFHALDTLLRSLLEDTEGAVP